MDIQRSHIPPSLKKTSNTPYLLPSLPERETRPTAKFPLPIPEVVDRRGTQSNVIPLQHFKLEATLQIVNRSTPISRLRRISRWPDKGRFRLAPVCREGLISFISHFPVVSEAYIFFYILFSPPLYFWPSQVVLKQLCRQKTTKILYPSLPAYPPPLFFSLKAKSEDQTFPQRAPFLRLPQQKPTRKEETACIQMCRGEAKMFSRKSICVVRGISSKPKLMLQRNRNLSWYCPILPPPPPPPQKKGSG